MCFKCMALLEIYNVYVTHNDYYNYYIDLPMYATTYILIL